MAMQGTDYLLSLGYEVAVPVYDEDKMRFYVRPSLEYDPTQWMPSVTTILSIAVPEKLKTYFVQTAHAEQYKTLKMAQDMGVLIHGLIDDDLLGKEPTVPENAKGAFEKWLAVKSKFQITADAVEVTLFDSVLGYAGTADIIGTFNGHPAIMDVKTGYFGYKPGFQLAAYLRAYNYMFGSKTDLKLVGLRITRDGTIGEPFVYEHIDWIWNAFLAHFQVWKANYYGKLNKMGWRWLHRDAVSPMYTIRER